MIDVGSPKAGKLGWAIRKAETRAHGGDLDQFINEFARLCDGCPAALGFEAPLFVPIRGAASELTNARRGEGSRPWSASAGATVLAVALPIMIYTFGRLHSELDGYEATLDWKNWDGSTRSLLVWEAFVSGSSKGADHSEDADIAAAAFIRGCDNLDARNAVAESIVFSLAGAALIYSGWLTPSVGTLKQPALVIKA